MEHFKDPNPEEEKLIERIYQALSGTDMSSEDIAIFIRMRFGKMNEDPNEIERVIKEFIDDVVIDEETNLYRLNTLSARLSRFELPENFKYLINLDQRLQEFKNYTYEERTTIYAEDLKLLLKKIKSEELTCAKMFNDFPQEIQNYIERKNLIPSKLVNNFRKIEFDIQTQEADKINPDQNSTTTEDADLNQEITDLEDLIGLITDEEIYTSLIFPLKYQNFPGLEEIEDNQENFKTIFKSQYSSASELIDNLFEGFDLDYITEDEEAAINWMVYDMLKANQTLTVGTEIESLITSLRNPLRTFFNQLDENLENISFLDENQDFKAILNEVSRDNKITDSERSYIFEKAREHFVDLNRLNAYLENPFIGYEPFKLIVDQICLDGVITETESNYLREKAEEYNVDEDQLNTLITLGILRSKRIKSLIEYDDFYDIVLSALMANAFNIKSVKNLLYKKIKLDEEESELIENLHSFSRLLFSELSKKMILKCPYLRIFNNISEIYNFFQIQFPSLELVIKSFEEEKTIQTLQVVYNNDHLSDLSKVFFTNNPQCNRIEYSVNDGMSVFKLNELGYENDFKPLLVKMISTLNKLAFENNDVDLLKLFVEKMNQKES